ncbi:ferrochelatase [Chloroherpeton thalassium ATCC 35110]|uniref:coproporphyrin ferrochelatase n=1 Tax=Chloroherpeton thalassium (strain ATCC 35110 / GB-78) TaxID=517418 RepID=B3QWM3_CHLT3|nr:ferrochelatase [Chloroherpeton thalassium]ACF14783.1 ferrochelatase [Chloroherpeton thalassium ATCC 35110]
MKKKIAVIVAAHGEAETPSFLENYQVTKQTMSHAAAVMPVPKPLQTLIAITSGVRNGVNWSIDGYRSPHNQNTREQAAAIKDGLEKQEAAKNVHFDVFPAFFASPPFVEDVIQSTAHYDGQIVASMTPIESRLSCGLVCHYLTENGHVHDLNKIKILTQHWKHDEVTRILVDHIFGARAFKANSRDESRALLLVLHGTLQKDTNGNPPGFHAGLDETLSFAEKLKQAVLNDKRNFYGQVIPVYLNHEVGGKWTEPSLENALKKLHKEKVRHVALFPCGYFVDGSETTGRAKKELFKSGIRNAIYIDSINSEPEFISYFVKRISSAAQSILKWKELQENITV